VSCIDKSAAYVRASITRHASAAHLEDLHLRDALDDGGHGVVDVAGDERGQVKADGEPTQGGGGGGGEAGERRGVDALG